MERERERRRERERETGGRDIYINTVKYAERVKYREINEERVCERDGHSESKRERERE